MEETNKTTVPTLKEIRVSQDKTQQEIAQSLGVSKQAVSLWEKGKQSPTLEKAVKLAKMLNISLDELAQSMGIDDK